MRLKQKDTICKNIKTEYSEVKKQLKKLTQKNSLFQSYILSQKDFAVSSYLKRFTEVRAASSEITAILIEFTRKYLCILIHHLIKAGHGKFSYTNLIVFRVGDLLRSKFQCTESVFINVLNTLYLLDGNKQMEGIFKLVRIKNKLNQKDNNILINYLFLGKVQCELQLSIQDLDKKDKNYYAFSHFLYELTRGNFGVLTECATIVSQHDPVVNGCQEAYYRPKLYELLASSKKRQHSIHAKDENLYLCWQCRKLAIRENVGLFSEEESTCNQCIVRQHKPQQKLTREINLRQCLLENLESGHLRKIKKYSEAQPGTYVLSISNRKVKSIPKLYRLWQNKREFKLVLIELNNKVLLNFDQPEFDYSSINYFDASDKKQSTSELTYLVGEANINNIIDILDFDSSRLQRIKQFEEAFESYILQIHLINTVKFKCQILDFRGDLKKLQVMNEVATAYGQNKPQLLKYKRYHSLEYNHLKKVNLSAMKLKEVPPFLDYADGIKILQLQENLLTNFSLEKSVRLQRLILANNKLQNIDLSTLLSLSFINLSKNPLKKIDLSQNSALSRLQMTYTELTQIDLRHNLALSNINLLYNNLSKINFCYSNRMNSYQVEFSYQNAKECEVQILYQWDQQADCQKMKDKMIDILDGRQQQCQYHFKLQARG